MRVRNIIFIIALILEVSFIILIIVKKSNHKLPGYLSLGLLVVLLVLTFWLMLFPKYDEIKPTGEYTVGYFTENYTDDSRIEEFKNDGSKRELEVGTWYPVDANKKCPYIVFSHGSFGTIDNNKTLCMELASKGYMVTSISHTYHAFETKLSSGEKVKIGSSFMNELMGENAKKDKEKSFNLYQKWMKLRMDDISFVIDTQLNLAKNNHSVFSNIDENKIVTMGHSLGGSAALGIGRIRTDIKAVIALESPFMYDIVGVENNEFVINDEPYPIACLNIYSDSSYNKLDSLPQYKQNYNILQSNDSKYVNYYMKGIGHMHLCDFQLTSPFLSMILSGTDSTATAKKNLTKINEVVLEFLKNQNI